MSEDNTFLVVRWEQVKRLDCLLRQGNRSAEVLDVSASCRQTRKIAVRAASADALNTHLPL